MVRRINVHVVESALLFSIRCVVCVSGDEVLCREAHCITIPRIITTVSLPFPKKSNLTYDL